jgi:hypothetical protein
LVAISDPWGGGDQNAVWRALRDPIAGLRRIFDHLPEGGREPAVGHGTTNEAAVFALPAGRVAAIAKGAGVLIVLEADNPGDLTMPDTQSYWLMPARGEMPPPVPSQPEPEPPRRTTRA